MYDALVTQTQAVLSRWSADATRREARLRATTPMEGEDDEEEFAESQEGAVVGEPLRPPDKYGLDIDAEFRSAKRSWTYDSDEAHKMIFEVLLDCLLLS